MRRTVWCVVMASAVWLGCGSSRDRAGGGTDAGARMCGEPGSVLGGLPCMCDEDCAGASAICADEATIGAPGGFCAPPCESDADCGEGRVCEMFSGETLGLCSIACTTHADCPPGNVCFVDTCYPYCQRDDECLSGLCDPYSRACNKGADPPGAGLYASCVRDDDCRSGSCDADTGRCTTLCLVSEQDCPEGAVCVGVFFEEDVGVCHPRCVDGSCEDPGLECRDAGTPAGEQVCMAPEGGAGCMGRADGNTDGRVCGCDDDCLPGTLCAEEDTSGQPGGMCLRRCEVTTDCPDESTVCNGVYCTPSCSEDSDCGPGPRICSGRQCMPFCTTDADCAAGTCNPYSGDCEPVPTDGLEMGAACSADEECRSEICLMAGRDVGVCSSFCRVSAQTCPDGAVCAGDGLDDTGICYPPCTDTTDCPAGGWVCTPTHFPADAPDHCE